MYRHRLISVLLVTVALVTFLSSIASAQQHSSPAALISAQRDAMARLASMDGVWRGPAWIVLPSGEKRTTTQTERIGPFLDGSLKVIEGRSYDGDGKIVFNAFAIVSFDPKDETYTMRTYAMGNSADVKLTPTTDGYKWEIPVGPTTMGYTVTIKNGTWHEIGERITSGKDPVQFFEMNLKRIGDSTWPAGGAIAAN